MDILATSIWLRYLQENQIHLPFPSNGYQGAYVTQLANTLQQQIGNRAVRDVTQIYTEVPLDSQTDGSGDKEAHIDGLIANAKKLLGDDYTSIFNLGLHTILADMRNDLAEFGVVYDEWFSEQSLVKSGASERAFALLAQKGLLFEKENALWFASTQFGDDKDRVIKRANGDNTYFGNDIAYHYSKLERGYQRIIDVLGADHHGYTPRIRAVLAALTDNFELHVPLLQFVNLYRGTEKVSMSTRSGEFVTLRELRQEVGNDAARFFYIMRKAEQPIDFDLELAKSKSNENPVYYLQYAHARVCSVLRQLAEKNIAWTTGQGIDSIELLVLPEEIALMKMLMRYPETLIQAAENYEPHLLVQYLRELANDFHSYYNNHTFIVAQTSLREARLNLIVAIKQVLKNALQILGLQAPEVM
jgi:arginyl-tRNA synthetase